MKIRKLPPDVLSCLRSDVTITCTPQCVTELVLNAIDARATSIAVRVNLNLFKLQVIDNGCGLSGKELEHIGTRYMTSKCHSIDDLHNNLGHFGFRGEALSSLREVAGTLSIVSRPRGSDDTFCKVFIQGQPQQTGVSSSCRASHGTTITVGDFLFNRPVRRARVRPALELEEIKLHMESIALINPQISFSLQNDATNEIILQTFKTGDYVKTFSALFGEDIAKTLVSVYGSCGPFSVQGFIGKEAHSLKNLQFVYINKRLLLKTKLHKLINSIMSRSSIIKSNNGPYVPISKEINHSVFLAFSPPKRDKHAIFMINITCPHAEYDITLDPKKTLIEFVDWNRILSCIESTVRAFIEEQSGEEMPKVATTSSPISRKRSVLEEIDELALEDARGVEEVSRVGSVSTKDISRAVHTLPLNRNAVKFGCEESGGSLHYTSGPDFARDSLPQTVTQSSSSGRTENPYPTPLSVVHMHRKGLRVLVNKKDLLGEKEKCFSSDSEEENASLGECKTTFKQPKLSSKEVLPTNQDRLLPSKSAHFDENFRKLAAELQFPVDTVLPTPSEPSPINPLASIKEIRRKSLLKNLSKFSYDVACEKPQLVRRVTQTKERDFCVKHETASQNPAAIVKSNLTGRVEPVMVESKASQTISPASSVINARPSVTVCDQKANDSSQNSRAVLSSSAINFSDKLLKKNTDAQPRSCLSHKIVFTSDSSVLPKKPVDIGIKDLSASNESKICNVVTKSDDVVSLRENMHQHPTGKKEVVKDTTSLTQKGMLYSHKEGNCCSCLKGEEIKSLCKSFQTGCRMKSNLEAVKNNFSDLINHKTVSLKLPEDLAKETNVEEAKSQYVDQRPSNNASVSLEKCSKSRPILCESTTPPHMKRLVDYDSSDSSPLISCDSSVFSDSGEQDYCRKRHNASTAHEAPKRICFPRDTCKTSPISETGFSEASTLIWPFPNPICDPHENEVPSQENSSLHVSQCTRFFSSDFMMDKHQDVPVSKVNAISNSHSPCKNPLDDLEYPNYFSRRKDKHSNDSGKVEFNLSMLESSSQNIALFNSYIKDLDYFKPVPEMGKPHLELSLPVVGSEKSSTFFSASIAVPVSKHSLTQSMVDLEPQSSEAGTNCNKLSVRTSCLRWMCDNQSHNKHVPDSALTGSVQAPTKPQTLSARSGRIENPSPIPFSVVPREENICSAKRALIESGGSSPKSLRSKEQLATAKNLSDMCKEPINPLKKMLSNNSDNSLTRDRSCFDQTSQTTGTGLPASMTSVISMPSVSSAVNLSDKPELSSTLLSESDCISGEKVSNNLKNKNKSQTCDSFAMCDVGGSPTKSSHHRHFETVQHHNGWTEHQDECGQAFYIHTQSGMTTYIKPQKDLEQNTFIMNDRFSFIPKGMSPIMKEHREREKLKASSLSENKKKDLLHTVAKYSDPEELSTVKWANFPDNGSGLWPLVDQLLSQASGATISESTEPQIPSASVQNMSVSDIKVYNVMYPYTFSKDIFTKLRVIGQLDNKFIVTVISLDVANEKTDVIVLFDQHAVHERIRVENLTQEYCNPDGKTNWCSSPVEPALPLCLSAKEVRVLSSFHDRMERLGLVYKVLDSNTISVQRVPTCLLLRENREIQSRGESVLRQHLESLVREQVDSLLTTRGAGTEYPSIIRSVISSEACRGAVKFGHALSVPDCEAFLHNLSSCYLPFQCAHGRPALVPIADLSQVQRKRPVSKPNLAKLKRYLPK